jgi:hypothetical protein
MAEFEIMTAYKLGLNDTTFDSPFPALRERGVLWNSATKQTCIEKGSEMRRFTR